MGWFKRKSKVKEVPKPAVCDHKWKDFPWFYKAVYQLQEHKLYFKVIEPFVCIHCKKRMDKVLFENNSYYKTYDEANDYVNNFKKEYADHMEKEVIVEDMIADMQLVDREYLVIAESLMMYPRPQVGQKPIELKVAEELKT